MNAAFLPKHCLGVSELFHSPVLLLRAKPVPVSAVFWRLPALVYKEENTVEFSNSFLEIIQQLHK